MDKDNRNTVVFMVCAMALLILYQMFVLAPHERARQQAQAAAAAAEAKLHPAPTAQTQAAARTPSDVGSIPSNERVSIDTPKLGGSIALVGARFDDLYLKAYHQTLDPKSNLIRLLRPADVDHSWLAEMNWEGPAGMNMPNANTVWTAAPGAVLTPMSPLQLSYDNGQGLVFHRTIAIDSNYMFAVADSVTNTGKAPVTINAVNAIEQRGLPADPSTSSLVFEGAIGELGKKLVQTRYQCHFGMLFCDDWTKKQLVETDSVGGWLGLTQKYWLTALIPEQSTPIKTSYRVTPVDTNISTYEVDYRGPVQTVAPGATLSVASHMFAGPKVVPLLNSYGKSLGLPQFDNAVDWGIFWFFTHPLFALLEWFHKYLGSIGVAILALTIAVRGALFPLSNKAYESSTKMRKLQPQIEAIKKKFPDDQAAQQKEQMALYQREKINPLLGCLPMVIQIPVIYSLTKLFTVTIEMRQAPFFGWIHDLSAKDPTTIWNLFGLIHWNPATVPFIGQTLDTSLHVGLWPIMYGFTMWLTQSMSPASPDPAQQRIFALMPLIFTFTLSQFTVGLLIYWTWSNLISIAQQYINMHHYKVENPIDNLIGKFIKPKAA